MLRQSFGTFSRASPLTGRVITIAFALIVAAMVCAGLAGWKLWQDARVEAEHDANNMAVVLVEQTGRSLQTVALALRDVQTEVTQRHITTSEGFQDELGRRAFHDLLAARMKDLPQESPIAVLTADGKLLNFSREWPIPPLDLNDRDFVQYCHGPDHERRFVSSTVADRIDGRQTFFLAQCMSSPDGSLIGVLVASLQIDRLMNFYQSIGLPSGMSVAIRRLDGMSIVRFPNSGPGAPPHGPDIGGDRLIARQALAGYPLVVEVGVSRANALALWRQEIYWILIGSACAIACLLFLLRKLVALIRRFERSQRILVARNHALSSARRRLESQALALVQTADALRESEASFAKQSTVLQTTLEHIDQGLMMVTADGVVAVFNRRAMDMLGLPPELMQSAPAFSDVLDHQWLSGEFSVSTDQIQQFIRSGGILDRAHTYERLRPNGDVLEVCSVPLDGGGMVRTYTDITARKKTEERLTYLAFHDELTGLANRRVLHDSLEAALQSAGSDELAVLYLDLDRFKLVNDTRGHEIGDQLLFQVARRMQSCLRETDLVARLGGDEFAAILRSNAGRSTALALANRLKAAVSAAYELNGEISRVGVSIGIALYPRDGLTAEELLRGADSALYRAKAAGRNTVRCHEQAAEQEDRVRLILEQDLRLALEREEFELAYQPIFNVATHLPTSVEALIRWRHPTRGLLSPDQFIPVAEQTGVINALGLWAMRVACGEAATWALPVRLAINLSSLQFAQPELEAQIVEALDASGLPPDRLDLEVTESVLINDVNGVRETMLALQRRGVRFVMDDFGTGHSSLEALQSFPFQQIKIDRAFVATVHEEERAGAIIRAMLTMAAAMQLDVVAEGVETTAQLEVLRQLGCHHVQGFLLQRPQTPEWIRDLLWRCNVSRTTEPADRLVAI